MRNTVEQCKKQITKLQQEKEALQEKVKFIPDPVFDSIMKIQEKEKEGDDQAIILMDQVK